MAGLIFDSNLIKGLIMDGRPVTAIIGGVQVWPIGYDFYRLEVGWSHYSTNDNLTFQGMSANGSMLTSPQVPAGRHKKYQDGVWSDMTVGDISKARGAGTDAATFYAHQCQFDISGVKPTTITWKAGQYYAPEGAITAAVYGMRNGNATQLASSSFTQQPNATYTMNL